MEDRWLSVDEISVYRVVTKDKVYKWLFELEFKFLDSLVGKCYLLNIIPNSCNNQIKFRGGAYINLYEKPGSPI
jgi:hypothetical protein